MKLNKCVYGILVKDSNERAGMIVGITQNTQAKPEAIPLIKWSDGEVFGIHHFNIEKL